MCVCYFYDGKKYSILVFSHFSINTRRNVYAHMSFNVGCFYLLLSFSVNVLMALLFIISLRTFNSGIYILPLCIMSSTWWWKKTKVFFLLSIVDQMHAVLNVLKSMSDSVRSKLLIKKAWWYCSEVIWMVMLCDKMILYWMEKTICSYSMWHFA